MNAEEGLIGWGKGWNRIDHAAVVHLLEADNAFNLHLFSIFFFFFLYNFWNGELQTDGTNEKPNAHRNWLNVIQMRHRS